MKTLFALLFLSSCAVCYAQTLPPVYHPLKGVVRDYGTKFFGTDAYSRSHPGDGSHAPTEADLERMGHGNGGTVDADGRQVHYVWVPGTAHDHRIVVEGAGYSPTARAWINQHWRVGGPAPPEAAASVAHLASSPRRQEGTEHLRPVAHSSNPFAVIAAIVVGLLAAATLGAVFARRSGASTDGGQPPRLL